MEVSSSYLYFCSSPLVVGSQCDCLQIIHLLMQANTVWIAVAIIFVILSMVISVSKWQLLLYAQEMGISWFELWRAYWALSCRAVYLQLGQMGRKIMPLKTCHLIK